MDLNIPLHQSMLIYGQVFCKTPLRIYLCNSPVVRAEPLCFSRDGVEKVLCNVMYYHQLIIVFYIKVFILKLKYNIIN